MKRESNVRISGQTNDQDIPKKGGNSEMIKEIAEETTGVEDYARLLQHELKFLRIENRLLRNKNQQLQEDRQSLEAENELLEDDNLSLHKENQQLQKQVNTHGWEWEFDVGLVLLGFFFVMTTAVVILLCVLILGAMFL
ncbi:hypothetical protein SI65_05057 [Aspergillus cristatus]|uniref:Uncharacterized protein n=1 Tax=Aspergillus cristatus TaxID=573508 RepID=A0A1E3BH14_ASPCR|nr:hypothetical protein SI65_05057 [Aspergillus cristatus]